LQPAGQSDDRALSSATPHQGHCRKPCHGKFRSVRKSVTTVLLSPNRCATTPICQSLSRSPTDDISRDHGSPVSIGRTRIGHHWESSRNGGEELPKFRVSWIKPNRLESGHLAARSASPEKRGISTKVSSSEGTIPEPRILPNLTANFGAPGHGPSRCVTRRRRNSAHSVLHTRLSDALLLPGFSPGQSNGNGSV